MILWLTAFHLIAVICWFAAIFYLPRLFVYHAMAEDTVSIERFKVMERKLYRGIMTPSAIATAVFGIWLLVIRWDDLASSGWLWLKLAFVLALFGFHGLCGKLRRDFANDANTRDHKFFRWLNEAPVIALVVIVVLAVVKPF